MSDPNLDKATIENLGSLSRIQLTDEQIETFSLHLKKIVGYMTQLEEVDTSDLTPYSHMQEQGIDSLREDTIGTPLKKEAFLDNAPDHVGSMIRVPPVIKTPS